MGGFLFGCKYFFIIKSLCGWLFAVFWKTHNIFCIIDDFGVTSGVIAMEPFLNYFAPLTPGLKVSFSDIYFNGH